VTICLNNLKYSGQLQERFAFVESANDLPKPWSGSGILHIQVNPELAFHFLEFIFDVAYVDIMQRQASVLSMTRQLGNTCYVRKRLSAHIRLESYTVSVGSFGLSDKGTKGALKRTPSTLRRLSKKI